jgi:hypothetical protein
MHNVEVEKQTEINFVERFVADIGDIEYQSSKSHRIAFRH